MTGQVTVVQVSDYSESQIQEISMLSQPLPSKPVVGKDRLDNLPKVRGMISFSEMGQLMNDDVIHHRKRRQDDSPTEGDPIL